MIDSRFGRRPVRSIVHFSMCLTLLASLFAGCGGTPAQLPVYPVHGRVLFQGKPIAGAIVTFNLDGAPIPSSGVTNAKGEYQLSSYAENDGAIAGKHRVTVSIPMTQAELAKAPDADPPKAIVDLESPEYQAKMQKLADASSKAEQTPEGSKLPAKYAAIQTTDLIFEVKKEGDNNIDLLLKE